ncbi:cell wall-binding repeat-containing protein [Euzebya sp.]|uniref:cell wall-binding repeat-containing protein n=1 Tax=Euzebya sp. TaxID=1971409 RepID=UPI0035140600
MSLVEVDAPAAACHGRGGGRDAARRRLGRPPRGAPILLTATDAPHPATEAWLSDRPDAELVVLGGDAAVTDATATALGAAHTRVAGPNLFATAAAIADQLWPVEPAGFLITPGGTEDGWAFALTGASLAATTEQPILLTELDRLPTETGAAICATGAPVPTLLLVPAAQVGDGLTDSLGRC